MIGFKVPALAAFLACFVLDAAAQAKPATDPKAADPKKAEATTRAAPKKNAPKKKTTPKKAPPKKADEKAKTTPQGGTVQKYEAGKAPDLKDSKGNVIPTNPDAYDVSSATKPAPPRKK